MENQPILSKKVYFKNFINLLIILAVAIAILGFFADLLNSLKTPGIDLRNRIVGSRLLMKGLDPYHFKWTPEFPETLLDPLDKPASPVTRTTVTPSVLVLLTPIAILPYKTIRLLWFIFQWTALLLCLYIFSKSSKSSEKAKLIWFICLVFIAGSHAWRFHIERGQIYILYVVILTVAYRLFLASDRWSSIFSGLLIGLVASMKFTVIFFGLPLLIYRRWKSLIGALAGFILGFVGPIFLGGIQIWISYFNAMREFGAIRYSWSQMMPGNYPQIIEGMNWQGKPFPMVGGETSIFKIAHKFIGLDVSNFLILVVVVTFIICLVFLYFNRRSELSLNLIFLIGIFLDFLYGFLLPAFRYNYQDVIWLILISLVIINVDSLKELKNPFLILAFVGLCLSVGFTWLPGRNIIMEGAMLIFFATTISGFIRRSSRMNKIKY